MLAFETAKRLDQYREENQVAFLGVIGLPSHIKNPMSHLKSQECLRNLWVFVNLMLAQLIKKVEHQTATTYFKAFALHRTLIASSSSQSQRSTSASGLLFPVICAKPLLTASQIDMFRGSMAPTASLLIHFHFQNKTGG